MSAVACLLINLASYVLICGSCTLKSVLNSVAFGFLDCLKHFSPSKTNILIYHCRFSESSRSHDSLSSLIVLLYIKVQISIVLLLNSQLKVKIKCSLPFKNILCMTQFTMHVTHLRCMFLCSLNFNLVFAVHSFVIEQR